MNNKGNVKITYPSGKEITANYGVTAADLLKNEFPNPEQPIVAVRVNNYIASFSYRLTIDSLVEPVTLESREGTEIYRRSLCFLLTLTSKQLFPDRRLVISNSLGKGFFYYYDGLDRIPGEELELIDRIMRKLASENLPISREILSYHQAMEYFETSGQLDTALLLKYRNDPEITTNACGGFRDIYHSPLVPTTGILNTFEVKAYGTGFLLRYFPYGKPGVIEPFKDNRLLFAIYKEYKNWGKILNTHCIGALNERILNKKVKEFINISEALQNKKIANLADKILEKSDKVKVVLIAGPSSSGKTTFSKKLAIQLKVNGLNPYNISIDDYFVDKELSPRDEKGNYDFESIHALNLSLLNEHLVALFEGKEIELPSYNFKEGKSFPSGKKLRLPENGILVLEGIHGLNDELTGRIDRSMKYKIYISALTQLNIDDHNRISTTENRLLRRLVRDYQFRGSSAFGTLTMWPSVRRGEKRNIFPYQNSADSAFNSALDYELAILKVYAEPLLKTVKPDVPVYNEARKLLKFLNNFVPIPSSWVPPNSILREFIGEGSFKY